MKAKLYRTNGAVETIAPANGKSFSLTELQKLVGGYIECLYLMDGSTMVVNEEGKLHNLPFNLNATNIFQTNFRAHDFIVGDAVIYK